MKAYVAVTDFDWYSYLSSRPLIREGNFWRPYGSRSFRVLEPGEPFLFKAKVPLNKIVGGAIYEGFVSLNISRAWEFFGQGNGVSSAETLIQRIGKITGETQSQIGDREIGCVLLRDLHFFPKNEQWPTPMTFSSNIVQGKSFTYPGEDSIVDAVALRILNRDDLATVASKREHREPRVDVRNSSTCRTSTWSRRIQGFRARGIRSAMRHHSPPDFADPPSSTYLPRFSRWPTPHR